MTEPQQTPIPQPGQIKTIVVVDLNGRTHTYVDLLEALTAVYRLPQVAQRGVRALVEGVHEAKGGGTNS
jgi:hypothetical protein